MAAAAFGADILPALEDQMASGSDVSCLQPVHLQLALLHGKQGERVLHQCWQAWCHQSIGLMTPLSQQRLRTCHIHILLR